MPKHRIAKQSVLGAALACACFLVLATTCLARTEIAKLTTAEPTSGLASVAIDGDWIVVGAPFHNQIGAAIIFHFEQGAWVEHTRFNAPGGLHAAYGRSVAIEGELIAIGSPYDGPEGVQSGGAGLYRLQEGQWLPEQGLVPSGSAVNDYYGAAVSMSGGRVVIGARGLENLTGAVYVFAHDGTSWVEEAMLTASDAAEDDRFGARVSIDGNLLLIGAPRNDEAGFEAGAAYVFRFDGTAWIEEDKLLPSDAAEFFGFGSHVSLHADGAIIGATGKSDVGLASGAAYVFRRDTGSWIEEAKLVASDNAHLLRFGLGVAMRENVVLVGTEGGTPSSTYLFKSYSKQWYELDKLTASDGAGQGFMAIDGDLAAVLGSGGVYVFSLAGDIPTVSAWGVVVLAGVLMVAGTLILRRRRVAALASASAQANRLRHPLP